MGTTALANQILSLLAIRKSRSDKVKWGKGLWLVRIWIREDHKFTLVKECGQICAKETNLRQAKDTGVGELTDECIKPACVRIWSTF